jgi:hypothetical protein
LRRSNPELDSPEDGLLRGACHRAALCADPLARNDGGPQDRQSVPTIPAYEKTVARREERAFAHPLIRISNSRYDFAISRRHSPEVCHQYPALSIQRARGMPGADAPAAKNCARSAPRSHRKHPASPRNGLRLMSCSPRRSAFLPPSPAGPTAGLTPASRCQDHTSSPSASASPVSRAFASTAAHPYVRDVRETPLRVERDAINID